MSTHFGLLDQFLPEYQFRSRHEISVRGSAEHVYQSLKQVDLADSFLIRSLFRLRGIPLRKITFESLQKIGFNWLGDDPDREICLGVVGQFWTLSGNLRVLTPKQFQEFSEPGFAKALWHCGVQAEPAGSTRLSTETRILCLDENSYRKFRRYWRFISPFSSWIRSLTLKLVKQRAEGDRP